VLGGNFSVDENERREKERNEGGSWLPK